MVTVIHMIGGTRKTKRRRAAVRQAVCRYLILRQGLAGGRNLVGKTQHDEACHAEHAQQQSLDPGEAYLHCAPKPRMMSLTRGSFEVNQCDNVPAALPKVDMQAPEAGGCWR